MPPYPVSPCCVSDQQPKLAFIKEGMKKHNAEATGRRYVKGLQKIIIEGVN